MSHTKPHFFTSPLLKSIPCVKHAFFTRQGGYGQKLYACGLSSTDNPDHVQKNRKVAMQALGFSDHNSLYTLRQIHSTRVVTLSKVITEEEQADGLVTNTPGIGLGILTADCAPLLFVDGQAKVIGAAHSGWKGALGGVIENTIMAMEKLGAKRHNIKAAIGPTIQQKSYEVGPEFHNRFFLDSQDNNRFFIPSQKNNHFLFNLPHYVYEKIKQSHISFIDDLARDTYSDPLNFFSYRRSYLENEKGYGNQLSLIILS